MKPTTPLNDFGKGMLVAFLIFLLLLLLAGCSDNEIEEPTCVCESIESITKVVTVNGLPRIKVTKIYKIMSKEITNQPFFDLRKEYMQDTGLVAYSKESMPTYIYWLEERILRNTPVSSIRD
jgi:hypothetical protein